MNKHKKVFLFLGVTLLTSVTSGCQILSDSTSNSENAMSTVVAKLPAEDIENEITSIEEEKEDTSETDSEVNQEEESEEKEDILVEKNLESKNEKPVVSEDASVAKTEKPEQVTASELQEEKKESEQDKVKEVKISSSDVPEEENDSPEDNTDHKDKDTDGAVMKEETESVEVTEEKVESEKIFFNKKATIPVNHYLLPPNNSTERTEEVTHVLVHFASSALLKPTDPYRVEDIFSIFKDYGVSAHYVIDRKGKIHLFVEEDRVAYHAGKGSLSQYPEYKDVLNYHSIGIELLAMGTREEMIPMISEKQFNKVDPSQLGYTDSQYTALKALIDDIIARHPSIKKDRQHVIGHDEYAPGRKTDPGSLFDWNKIGF